MGSISLSEMNKISQAIAQGNKAELESLLSHHRGSLDQRLFDELLGIACNQEQLSKPIIIMLWCFLNASIESLQAEQQLKLIRLFNNSADFAYIDLIFQSNISVDSIHQLSFIEKNQLLREVVQRSNSLRSSNLMITRLINAGADINLPNTYGLTPLMDAAVAGDLRLVNDLIALHKANMNIRCDYGYTALDWARYVGQHAIVDLLSRLSQNLSVVNNLAPQQSHLSIENNSLYRVISLDFDGALFHEKYLLSDDKDVIKYNMPFLSSLQQENKQFAKVIGMIGSNRQAFHHDRFNACVEIVEDGINYGRRGSCFPAMQRICEYLKIDLDPFLMADLYGDLENGTSFYKALADTAGYENNSDQAQHAIWYFDESKATILYAQMHKIALENPDKKIYFDFYDDRIDILSGLYVFFSKNPGIIPANVNLNLHQYEDGVVLNNSCHIKGTGIIDSNYKNTVKTMARESSDRQELTIPGKRAVDRGVLLSASHVTAASFVNRVAYVAPADQSLQSSVMPSCSSSSAPEKRTAQEAQHRKRLTFHRTAPEKSAKEQPEAKRLRM